MWNYLAFKTMILSFVLIIGCSNKRDQISIVMNTPEESGLSNRCQPGFTLVNQECLLQVMPIGDSITHGMNVEAGGSLGGTYRCALFEKLLSEYPSLEFVGSNKGLAFGPGTPPGYECHSKAENHEGWGGQTTSQLNQILKLRHVKKLIPNMVLIHLGMNDLRLEETDQSLTNLKNMIHTIKNVRRGQGQPVIFVAQIHHIQDSSYDAIIDWLNAEISKLHDPSEQIYVVDLFEGVNLNMLQDGVHPNNEGALFHANRWAKAIQDFLNQRPLSTPKIRALTKEHITASFTRDSIILKWPQINGDESYFLLASGTDHFNEKFVVDPSSSPSINIPAVVGAKYYFSLFVCSNASAGNCYPYRLMLGPYSLEQ